METILANEILKAQNLILKRISKDYNIPLATLTGAKPRKKTPINHNHKPGLRGAEPCVACSQYGDPFDASALKFCVV